MDKMPKADRRQRVAQRERYKQLMPPRLVLLPGVSHDPRTLHLSGRTYSGLGLHGGALI